jgi:hypothetical protein
MVNYVRPSGTGGFGNATGYGLLDDGPRNSPGFFTQKSANDPRFAAEAPSGGLFSGIDCLKDALQLEVTSSAAIEMLSVDFSDRNASGGFLWLTTWSIFVSWSTVSGGGDFGAFGVNW